jgi:PKD repeat protein
MNFLGGLVKGVSGLVVSLLAFGIIRPDAAPTAGFSMYPDGNPVIGQTVQFTDTSTGGPTTWTWDFGDATGGSNQQNPAHTYAAPGTYQVTLTAGNGSGSTQIVQQVVVTPLDTLQLNNKGDHPFVVKLTATNQHNNNVQGAGQAIPQSDLFGYFSFPSLTNNPSNPEVFIKILDGRPINGQYWVFYGHLTDLIYDLSVTEVATGIVKTYHKDAGAQAPGNADTSGFVAAAPSPTPTPGSATTWVVNVGSQAGAIAFTDVHSNNSVSTIHVGDTVQWVFQSSTMYHSTTSGTCTSGGYYGGDCTADGNWDSGYQMSPAMYSHVFNTAGTFKYYCQAHTSSMTGSVVVLQ